jgi:hypothetical protein
MHDEDNDGRFPDESPVEVRYPRSKQEEQGDREQWPWLPGTIVESSAARTNGTCASRSANWACCAMAGARRAARPAVALLPVLLPGRRGDPAAHRV